MTNWDQRFLGLAKYVSSWSKDPSTQVGAVVADQNNRVCGVGFNGFARGVHDSSERLENRELKYKLVLHAEENALAFSRHTTDCTLYTWPLPPCAHCMSLAIQHGIRRIVSVDEVPERWAESIALSCEISTEAGIRLDLIELL